MTERIIVELKVVGAPSDAHVSQYRNYLWATGKPCAC
ncbi:GxxExxY protein [Acidisphaera sp. S103]|nr:GxxExxY protein [Acidisphaera sp. S103]